MFTFKVFSFLFVINILAISNVFGRENCDDQFWFLINNPTPISDKQIKQLTEKLNNFNGNRHSRATTRNGKINGLGIIKFPEAKHSIYYPGQENETAIQIYGQPYNYRGQVYIDYLDSPVHNKSVLRSVLLDDLIDMKVRQRYYSDIAVLVPEGNDVKVPHRKYNMAWVVKDLGEKIQVRFLDESTKVVSKNVIDRHNFAFNQKDLLELSLYYKAGHRGNIIFLPDREGRSMLGIQITYLNEKSKLLQAETYREIQKIASDGITIIYQTLSNYINAAALKHHDNVYARFFANELGTPLSPTLFITQRVDKHTLIHEKRHLYDFKQSLDQRLNEKINQLLKNKSHLDKNELRIIEAFVLELRAYNDQVSAVVKDSNMSSNEIFDSFLDARVEIPYEKYRVDITQTIEDKAKNYALKTNELLERIKEKEPQKFDELIAILYEFTQMPEATFTIDSLLPVIR